MDDRHRPVTGRGLFFLFCGTNIWDSSTNSVLSIVTWIVGGAAIFCGCLEFVFGCRCESQDDNMKIPEVQEQPQESQKKSGFFGVFGGGAGSDSGGPKASMSGAGTSAEPSFTVNVTASQAAAVAGAAAGVAKSAAASDNPFLETSTSRTESSGSHTLVQEGRSCGSAVFAV